MVSDYLLAKAGMTEDGNEVFRADTLALLRALISRGNSAAKYMSLPQNIISARSGAEMGASLFNSTPEEYERAKALATESGAISEPVQPLALSRGAEQMGPPMPQADSEDTQAQAIEHEAETKRQNLMAAPTSGHMAFANQYDGIDKLLGEYTEKPKDDFMDFLKLTLARSAMSKSPHILQSLAEGAGQATIDQMNMRKQKEADRLAAIKEMSDIAKDRELMAIKREELAQEGPVRAAQAEYYRGRGTGSPVKVTAALRKQGDDLIDNIIGITRGQNRSIKEGTDIDPNMRLEVHKRAEKYLGEGVGAADAYGAAVDEVIGSVENLKEETRGGGWFGIGGKDYLTRGTPSLEEIDAAIARKQKSGE